MTDTIRTPVGRLVGGSLHTKYEKDHKGNPKKTPNYFFAVAFEKNNQQFREVYEKLYAIAYTGYAHRPDIQNNIQVSYTNGFGPGFKFKIDDGDNPKFADRPAYRNCWILRATSQFEFPVVDSRNQQIDPKTVKLGYFVDFAFTCQTNGNTDETAGLYINPQCVRLIAFGEEIYTGPSPEMLMGAAPSTLPAGASTVPFAPSAAPALPGGTGIPPQQQYQQPAPAPQQQYQQPAPAPQQQYQQPAPQQQYQQPAPGNGVPPLPGYAPAAVPTGAPEVGAQTQTALPAGTAYPTNQQPPAVPGNIQPDHGFVTGVPGLPPLPGQ